uniref:Uncharacterized protein n=1 Tax=Aegilops tauschii TaxID=37682 RepID=M8BUJ3_AEGTA
MSLYAAKVVAVVLLCDKNRAIECQGCKGRASVACHCCESAGAGWVLLRVDTTPDLLEPMVRTRQPVLGKGAKVVPITLDQVYMLKAEGIAFRFLPDPLQIKNALQLNDEYYSLAFQLKSGLTGFDGVPVFQSDLLVVKKQKKRYCPVYFQKEDIERELRKASKSSKGSALSKQIMVGSLEDVLKKMEINDRNSGWDDLIFIPPGKSLNQHINEYVTQVHYFWEDTWADIEPFCQIPHPPMQCCENDVNFDKKVLYRLNQVIKCGGLPRSWAPLQRAEFREVMSTGEGRGHGGIFCY